VGDKLISRCDKELGIEITIDEKTQALKITVTNESEDMQALIEEAILDFASTYGGNVIKVGEAGA